MTEFDQTLKEVRLVLCELTGNEPGDVTENSSLEDELGVTEVDMGRIISQISNHFDINLDLEIAQEIETVKDLALIVHDEVSLG